MIIDAHQHYWKLARGDYSWMSPNLGEIYRDFLPGDLRPLREASGVAGTIVVQAADTEDETRFLLDLAKSDESILGVVGWVDMEASDFGPRLDNLISYGEGYLKAIRPMIQDIADANWILHGSLDRAFDALAERGLVFDALVMPFHLAQLEVRLKRHPKLKCVIDHGAKPDIANHARSAWSHAMSSIATNTRAYCKLSGLVTEAGPDWSGSDITPYIADLLYHFGPARLIWGSDWPVLNLASDYGAWFQLVKKCIQKLTAEQRARVFAKNAQQIYDVEVLCLQ